MQRERRLRNLMNDVEELLNELSAEANPDIQELRRIGDAIGDTKRAIAEQGQNATARIGQYASSVNGYITDYPRLAFITGAVIFGSIGYLTGMARRATR
jgi:ElaB/YqjD/DUF883 family membrane-anchored ribosome-binding protein